MIEPRMREVQQPADSIVLDQKELNDRLIQVLEEHKKAPEAEAEARRHWGGNSERTAMNRMDSPSSAFQDTFEEYGAKLNPEVMRLSVESDVPLHGQTDSASEEEEEDDDGDGPNEGSEDSDNGDGDDDKAEEEFFANQRQTKKKQSNPGSNQVSQQNSAEPEESRKRTDLGLRPGGIVKAKRRLLTDSAFAGRQACDDDRTETEAETENDSASQDDYPQTPLSAMPRPQGPIL